MLAGETAPYGRGSVSGCNDEAPIPSRDHRERLPYSRDGLTR